MTRNLIRFVARPAGPSLPRTTYEAFLDLLRPYEVESLVAGFNELAWQAWRGDFKNVQERTLYGGLAPVLATYALAIGSTAANAPKADRRKIREFHLHYLAINSVLDPLLDAQRDALAKAVVGTDVALLMPHRAAARLAATNCIIARVHRSQLIASTARLEELSKTWWIARRVDTDADQLRRAERILGMPVPIFVRAASALLAFAFSSTPKGCVVVERNIEREFLEKYDVGQDELRLAAYKLSTSREHLEEWMRGVESNFPDGTKHFVPTPLLTTPLLKLELADLPPYVCPSIDHFVSAIRDLVREAISQPGAIETDTRDLYGARLVDYVKASIEAAGVSCLDLDEIEGRTQRRADVLCHGQGRGLIVEIKRSLAPGALSRHLLRPEGIIAVFEHLLHAFEQCRATFGRRAWTACGLELKNMAAVILVDEPVGAEGAVFADLLGAQTQIELPFEVMSVIEFENAIGVLGTEGLVDLIRKKWAAGLRDVPLTMYATNVAKIRPARVAGKRKHLEPEERELFFETGLVARDFAAEWP